jgi:hypothetical protein
MPIFPRPAAAVKAAAGCPPVVLVFLLVALSVCAAPVPARAQLTFVLSPTLRSGAPGGTVTYTGSVTNNTGSAVQITGFNSRWLQSGTPAAIDQQSLFNYLNTSLAVGQTYSGNIFDVKIDTGAPLGGQYDGEISLEYNGGEGFSDLRLFSLDVTVIPEPGTATLLGLPLTLGLLRTARRRRSRPAPVA